MKCTICGSTRFKTYRGRNNALCTKCGSLERHRAVYPFLTEEEWMSVLHFAPEPCLARHLRKSPYYVAADLKSRKGIRKANLLKLPFANEQFDLAVCIHVLEHIADIYVALQELKRVAMTSIVMVPQKDGPTYRNPFAKTPDQKTKHHGQRNHEWSFGEDFQLILESVGFKVEHFPTQQVYICKAY